jgi:hypothetical protein
MISKGGHPMTGMSTTPSQDSAAQETEARNSPAGACMRCLRTPADILFVDLDDTTTQRRCMPCHLAEMAQILNELGKVQP